MSKIFSSSKEAILLLSMGTFLEYFDLNLFIHMAVILNTLFFPTSDKHTAYLLTAFAFCSTYIFRPIGAYVFGKMGDTIGRKSTIVLSTTLMALSCIGMGVLPTYAEIGITAAVIMVLCRVIQGMTSMGERIGAEVYLTEITSPPVRFPVVTIIACVSTLGGIGALGFATLVLKYDISWRVAFFGGAIVAVIGAIARTRLQETKEFIDYKKRYAAKVIEKIKEQDKAEILIKQANETIFNVPVSKLTTISFFLIQCAHPICFYFVYGYCTDVFKNTFHLSGAEIISNNFKVSILELLPQLSMMLLSYYFYPLKLIKLKLSLFFICVLSLPLALSMVSTPNELLTVQIIFALCALGSSPGLGVFYSHFPVSQRFTYSGVIYAVARALMYIITSYAMIYLVKWLGYYGLLIVMLPVTTGYYFGLRYFEKLEKAKGCYPSGWLNFKSPQYEPYK